MSLLQFLLISAKVSLEIASTKSVFLSWTNLLSFLGEKYDYTLKDYYKRKKKWYSHKLSKPATIYGENHGHYRNWQINQPLFDGRGKYKELTAEELAFVNRIAGPMLVEFGYVKADDSKH